MSNRPIATEVQHVFDSYPKEVGTVLLRLRTIILELADQTKGVGQIEEALKWGQVSYLTPETKSGTTIRIDAPDDESDKLALYVHCQTSLVNSFKKEYPKILEYEGTRCVRFDPSNKEAMSAVEKFIVKALTYHQNG